MIFCLNLVLAMARPVEEAMVGQIGFKVNGVEVSQSVYPEFRGWDFNYSAGFSIQPFDLVEVKAKALYENALLFITVNSEPYESLPNNSYFTLPNLSLQENTIQILSSYYTRDHIYVNYTYLITVFYSAFKMSAELSTGAVYFTGSSIINNVTSPVNLLNKDLSVNISTSADNSVRIRHLSSVSVGDYINIPCNTQTSFQNFFSNWLENTLEVTVFNASARQIFFFILHQSLPDNEIYSMNVSFDKAVDFRGWDLMPRFHPQVSNYILVSKFPSAAYGKTHIVIKTNAISVCYLTINPSNMISSYRWRTNSMSDGVWMTLKEDYMNLYCTSLSETYRTLNYTIWYYRKSLNIMISTAVFFLNQITEMSGELKSNTSDLPANSGYTYDLSSFHNWSSIGSYNPPGHLILNSSRVMAIMTFDAIDYPLTPTALSMIFVPVDPGAYFKYNINGGEFDNDYYFSYKSVFPLTVGNNTVYLNITAEDKNFNIYNLYTIPVRNFDTSLKNLSFSPSLSKNSSSPQQYTVAVTSNQSYIEATIQLNCSKSAFFLYRDDQELLSNSSSGIFYINLDLNKTSEEFVVRVKAESRSWVQDYVLVFIRIDLCGDGRRWSGREACDDGNDVVGDGCFNCVVENGWMCSGGSFSTSDTCKQILNSSSNGTQTNNPTSSSGNPSENSSSSNNSNTDENSGGNQTASTDSDNNSTASNSTSEGSNNFTNSTPGYINSNITVETDVTLTSNIHESHYDWLLYLFMVVTVVVLIINLAVGGVFRRMVFKYKISGGMSTFVQMIWSFQWYFCMSHSVYKDNSGFLESFHWSALRNRQDSGVFNNIFTGNRYLRDTFNIWLLLTVIVIIHTLLRFKTSNRLLKILQVWWQYSVYLYLFFLFSPVLMFFSMNSLQSSNYSQSSALDILLSLVSILIITSTSIFLWFLNKKHSKSASIHKTFKIFKVLFEGLRFSDKPAPVELKKQQSEDLIFAGCANDYELKRHNSMEFERSDYKPKFYSAPWKRELREIEVCGEIPDFSLDEPCGRAIELVDQNNNLLVINYNLLNLYFSLLNFALLAAEIKIMIKTLLSCCVFTLQVIILWARKPYSQRIYNIMHVIKCTLMAILISVSGIEEINKTEAIIIMACSIFAVFLTLIGYEVAFFIKYSMKKITKYRSRQGAAKTKVFTDGNDRIHADLRVRKDNRLFTEQAVCVKEVPVRNCFSFYEIDMTVLSH